MEKEKIKLYLDDIRNPSDSVSYMHQRIGKLNPIYLEEWKVVRNYEQFKEYVENNELPEIISFDNDLADEHYAPETWEEGGDYKYKEKTGYECLKWFLEYFQTLENKELPLCIFHTMNTVALGNMINYYDNFKKINDRNNK